MTNADVIYMTIIAQTRRRERSKVVIFYQN